MQKIYLITTFNDFSSIGELSSTRSPGYYFNLEDAKWSVKNNNCDLYETCYNYALIEGVEEGLYPSCDERYWFKYNKEKDEYEEMPEPESMEHWVCLGGIG